MHRQSKSVELINVLSPIIIVDPCRGKEEALELALMLWREGFVYTVPAPSKQPQQQLPSQQHKKGHSGGILKGVQHSKQV